MLISLAFPAEKLGTAGLAAPYTCRFLPLRLPPSLEIFRIFCHALGLGSASSAENVLVSSKYPPEGNEGVEAVSLLLPIKPWNIIWFRGVVRLRESIVGSGGAECIPFCKDAPTGRSIVTICDVFDINDGSEISDLLTTLLRWGGMRPWLWKLCDVGVLFPDWSGEG